jgi:hypothetical protein
MYFRILFTALGVGIVVGLKRFLVGLYLGRRTYVAYGTALSKLMRDVLWVSRVAQLGKKLKQRHDPGFHLSLNDELVNLKSWKGFEKVQSSEDDDENKIKREYVSPAAANHGTSNARTEKSESKETADTINSNKSSFVAENLNWSDKMKVMHLLDEWDEPEQEATELVSKGCRLRV